MSGTKNRPTCVYFIIGIWCRWTATGEPLHTSIVIKVTCPSFQAGFVKWTFFPEIIRNFKNIYCYLYSPDFLLPTQVL